MKLLFKQRIFSWLDSYDIYDEKGVVAYTVKGQLSWGHKLVIYDAKGNKVGMVAEKVITILPKFEIYLGENLVGTIKKELTLLRPKFNLEAKGWNTKGNVFEWDYDITGPKGERVARIEKKLLRLVDTYVIDVAKKEDALLALMFVLAIDAEKCSRGE